MDAYSTEKKELQSGIRKTMEEGDDCRILEPPLRMNPECGGALCSPCVMSPIEF